MLQELYYYLRGTDKPNQPIHFSIRDLESFTDLTKSQQKLLVAMLSAIKTTQEASSVVCTADWKALGCSSRQAFHVDKTSLEDAGWIITSGRQYFVCMHKVKCTTKSYYDNLMVFLGLKPGITMGNRFKPDPNFVPKPPKHNHK